MKPNAIYSKSGKGVQEASGKTSLLKRADRAVLSAIDGRATLAEVAQKVGKTFDGPFQQLIAQLDKDGFVREVTAGSSTGSVATVKAAPSRAPVAKAKAAGAQDIGLDLDFTAIMPAVKRGAAAVAPAKEQEAALYKAREEAEARAQAERERVRQEAEAKARAEAEAKIRAETEKKLRSETDAKIKAEVDAKAKAVQEAAMRIAAEAKAKIEAEARAKIEAERRAREEAERKAKEEAEKARREAEELRQRLEAERKAREEEERKRREEEDRRRREEEAQRLQREAEERARREEEERLLREEEERRRREEIEAKAREAAEQARREEEDRQLREKEVRAAQARDMEEARARASRRHQEEEARARKSQDETHAAPAVPPLPRVEPSPANATSLDALMADLDSFSQREDEERQAREAADLKQRDQRKREVAEETERRARERAVQDERERRQRADEEARRRAEEERRAQEEAEQRVREAEEQRRREAEERTLRAREAQAAKPPPAPAPELDDIAIGEEDLGMDEVRRDESVVARETRKRERERERETRQRSREARERAEAAARTQVKYPKARRPVKWGRPVAITLFVVLVLGLGALHVVPIPMEEYEAAASQALGRPVRVGSARLSLFTGARLNLSNVTVGSDVRIATVHAYPRVGALIDQKKGFRRIELDGVSLPQRALADTLGARLRMDGFDVSRILAKNVKLEGALPLPALEADAAIGSDGRLRSVILSGPESLSGRLTPAANGDIEFEVTAASITVPFVRALTLSSFAMKGLANRQGMTIPSWGGAALDGVLSGTARVRWSGPWQVDGVVVARGINAAVFAPALLSEGKAEGSGRFSMSGTDPAKLYNSAHIEGSFSMGKGALGTVDLSRVLQTSGRQHGGRTLFTELNGQATYDRGAVALRNISMVAGALHAGLSAEIAPSGALAGRIVADMRTSVQPLRAVVVLGGTVKEPQVRN